MALNASQIINNLKRSFNVYLETSLPGATVNFDEDPFETDGLDAWYAVRYSGYSSEPVGMGEFIDDTGTKGRLHRLGCEVSAWSCGDSQRENLGDMIDLIMDCCEAGLVPFDDFADPQDPVNIGDMRIIVGVGSMTPLWGGSKGPVLKSSSDIHAGKRLAGFVLEIELEVISEI
ncbi:hypothetical protein KAU08_10435 [bacterium]|nr:hypothetical protein [bacterium]